MEYINNLKIVEIKYWYSAVESKKMHFQIIEHILDQSTFFYGY